MARLFSRELRGLTELETALSARWNGTKVCVVPGDADQDAHVLHEVGRSAATRLRSFLQSGSTLAVTGGTTIGQVAATLPGGTPMNVMVVPARGGIGRSLETQANTIACEIARRLGGHHRMMHLPDLLDEQALNEMRKLKEIDETLALLERADVVLHGIGRADEMARKPAASSRRGGGGARNGARCPRPTAAISTETVKWLCSASTVAHDLGKLKPDCAWIAVAAGTGKAEAIDGAMRAKPHRMLVVPDEGAAKAMLRAAMKVNCIARPG